MTLKEYEDAIENGDAPEDAPKDGFLCFKSHVMPSTLQHNIDELEEKIDEMQAKVDEFDGEDQDVSE